MDEIKLNVKGNWKRTRQYLSNANIKKIMHKLPKYGEQGVLALTYATPWDTGKTATSWNYEIHSSDGMVEIVWTNTNMAAPGMPIALLIQYGHGKKNGGYVKGIDYINPALRPIFQEMAETVWKEMTK